MCSNCCSIYKLACSDFNTFFWYQIFKCILFSLKTTNDRGLKIWFKKKNIWDSGRILCFKNCLCSLWITESFSTPPTQNQLQLFSICKISALWFADLGFHGDVFPFKIFWDHSITWRQNSVERFIGDLSQQINS